MSILSWGILGFTVKDSLLWEGCRNRYFSSYATNAIANNYCDKLRIFTEATEITLTVDDQRV